MFLSLAHEFNCKSAKKFEAEENNKFCILNIAILQLGRYYTWITVTQVPAKKFLLRKTLEITTFEQIDFVEVSLQNVIAIFAHFSVAFIRFRH